VRADALKVEKFIKSQKSRKFILHLISEKENKEFFKILAIDIFEDLILFHSIAVLLILY
jgi:hypothetical protein